MATFTLMFNLDQNKTCLQQIMIWYAHSGELLHFIYIFYISDIVCIRLLYVFYSPWTENPIAFSVTRSTRFQLSDRSCTMWLQLHGLVCWTTVFRSLSNDENYCFEWSNRETIVFFSMDPKCLCICLTGLEVWPDWAKAWKNGWPDIENAWPRAIWPAVCRCRPL